MSNQLEAEQKKSLSKRQFRRAIVIGLPFVGAQIVISVILFSQALSHLALIVLGFLLVEFGVLMLANRVVPNERRYNALRNETDNFLKLVRQLNTAALRKYKTDIPNYHKEFDKIQESMKASVDRMAAVAGKMDDELVGTEHEVLLKKVQHQS